MTRRVFRKLLSLQDFISKTVTLTEQVLSPEEREVQPGTGATSWRSSTPVAADLGAQFMKAEADDVDALDFTAADLEGDKDRIGELERGKAACDQSGEAFDRAISFYKERLARRVGRLQTHIQAHAKASSGTFRANAQPLLSFTSKVADKQVDRRRETTELRSTLEQLSAERALENKLQRGEKLSLEDLRPLAARTGRRPRPRKGK